MNKTIKTTKHMSFRELMEYIIQNDVSGTFKNCDGHQFKVDKHGTFNFAAYSYGYGETYEVEVEVEITEDMEFELVLINTASYLTMRHDYSIKRAKHTFNNVQEIFARIDGKLQKIWECE